MRKTCARGGSLPLHWESFEARGSTRTRGVMALEGRMLHFRWWSECRRVHTLIPERDGSVGLLQYRMMLMGSG